MDQARQTDAGARRKRLIGFTLAEILIALALIAVLAAVLLPAVAGQIMKGDAGRTMQDLNAVRAGIDQFLADVHRYPKFYNQLTTTLTGTSQDIHNSVYPAGLRAKWSGPYVSKTLNEDGVLPTGFGATIQDSMTKVLNTTNSVNYVTVRIFGIDSAGFARMELEIDGPSSTWTIARTTGMLRWNSAVGTDTTSFLATPIQ